MGDRETMLAALIGDCWEELGDVEKYAHMALERRGTDEDASDTFLALAKEEMGHYLRLHELALRRVKDAPELAGVWAFENKRLARRMMEAQAAIDCVRK